MKKIAWLLMLTLVCGMLHAQSTKESFDAALVPNAPIVVYADVADALKAQFDLDIDKKKIVIPEEIKTVGEYTVQVKLLASAVAEIRMSVVADA